VRASLRTAACILAASATGCSVPDRTLQPRRTPPMRSQPAASEAERAPAPVDAAARDAIVICGRRIPIGAPVVLWTEPPFYDATRTEPRFRDAGDVPAGKRGLRYRPGRARTLPAAGPSTGAEGEAGERRELGTEPAATETNVPPGSRDPAALAAAVDQFVLHYDACGLSRTCFRVLQDVRGLSVHFLLDLDGTIYQTMDVRDTAWHATKSNARSVGVEIANLGAYPPESSSLLDEWYRQDALGTRVVVPERITETGIRTPGFVARPARAARVAGVVQGERLEQHDFTPEQYESLVELAAVLCRELPLIAPDAPRDEHGAVIDRVLDDDAWSRFQGILGHHHVQANKTDPGPAFDWDGFLPRVRSRLDEIRPSGN